MDNFTPRFWKPQKVAQNLKKPNSSRKTCIYVIRRLKNKALKYGYYPKQSKSHIIVKHQYDQHAKNVFCRTKNNNTVSGAKHVGIVIQNLTFKEDYTTDAKLNFGTSNKSFYYKLLNWELNRHVHLISADSSTNFILLTNIVKSWTSYATSRRYYTIIMHSSDYRDVYMFREWEE